MPSLFYNYTPRGRDAGNDLSATIHYNPRAAGPTRASVTLANMVRLLHLPILGLYLSLPILALARAALLRRRDKPTAGRFGSIVVTFVAGLAIAVALCLFYGRALDGHVPARQVLLAAYFAMSLLLLLRCFDIGLLWGLRRAVGLRGPGPASVGRALKLVFVLLTRTAILFAIGLPFVMAAVMTYRPKVQPKDNPLTQLGFAFERVEFESSDGVKLVGWWMPAEDSRRSRLWEHWGKETAIVCHGLAAGKSNQLVLARRLVPAGFNVLAFDFRAHGESGGQLTGYGALEKRDVLAAVKWVRSSRPGQSRKVFGVGVSMGAVALLSAAADDSPEGRAINAVATYAAYDNLSALVDDLSGYWFRQPISFLTRHLAIPLASLHVGADLSSAGPDNLIDKLWPRPVLFIHGQLDDIIPFERGQALFERAQQPKFHVWFTEGSHNDIVTDESAARIVAEFFKSAAPVPVI